MVELGGEIELNALPGPWEGDSSDQQHEQDEVGERGCEIHHLQDRKWGQKAGVTSSTLCLSQKSPSYYLASPTLGQPKAGTATIQDASTSLPPSAH